MICAVLWLGNFAVTGLWSARAVFARSVELRVFATREILVTDVLFTLVFGSAVTVSGVFLAQHDAVPIWTTLWTRTAFEVVVAAGLVWMAVLLPLEIRMHRTAADESAARFSRLFTIWNVIGWLVTAALFAVIYLMVGKPT
ncbi:MAG: DUF2269 domain-containing protein [Candidatus Eremiobacteraeota bacterium]|nr:DUF2269 domain-containing protein [Candidatus Eremiobacteraeota bacterium]